MMKRVWKVDKSTDIAHLNDLIEFGLMPGLRHGEIPLLMSMVDDTVIRWRVSRTL